MCACVWAVAQVSQRQSRGVRLCIPRGGEGSRGRAGCRGSAAPPWGHRGMPPELRFGALINEPASARASVPGVLPCVHTLAHPHTRSLTHTPTCKDNVHLHSTHTYTTLLSTTRNSHTPKRMHWKDLDHPLSHFTPPIPPPPPLSLSLWRHKGSWTVWESLAGTKERLKFPFGL